ncbi:hypothetical protein [Lacipirellula sp.]|uniref:hypothetical protein n=1 Tax=Lacipirellula sp. TaxID=2691419 RepID=UPI003D0D08AB
MARDEFKTVTIERLGQRVNFRCSNPRCAAQTSGPSFDDDKAVSIGVAAHITAASPGGPRFDPELTPEQRQSFANGIWLCNNCSRVVDADAGQFTAEVLRKWKRLAEMATAKGLGVPTAVPSSNLARIAPARRFGADSAVVVGGRYISFTRTGFDNFDNTDSVTWFVQGFAVQFKVQKRDALAAIIVDGLEATVHNYQPVPEYQVLYGVYPIESSLYLIEVDRTTCDLPRQFSATKFYEHIPGTGTERYSEVARVAVPVIVNDSSPHGIVVRFNAKTPGLYTISLDVLVSAGDMSERCQVMEPRQVLFDAPEIFDDE